MNLVEVKGLSKSFNNNLVLDQIDFQIKRGTFTALLGKNGSGKSTILNILMGQEKLDSGECLLFGESVRKNPDHIKNRIGHVSEKIKFDYPMRMSQFIPEYGKLFDTFDVKMFRQIADDVAINLEKQFGEYSRGQKMQIVMIAAYCQRPELLLVDEITSVLDASTRNYFITLMQDYAKQGGAVVLTTNIVNEVQYHCSDVIFLSDSTIKFQTALKDIPVQFKKIRTQNREKDFLDPKLVVWSGTNSDGSQSYIVPNNFNVVAGMVEDRRAVTLEDLYIYFSQRQNVE